MTVGPLPTPVPQLDGSPQAKVNCGPASTASLLSHADANTFVPTPTNVRAWGSMGVGPTGFADQKRAVESAQVAQAFAARGLVAPTLVRLGYIERETVIRSLIRAQFDHLFAISYRVVIEHPTFAGDKDFAGAHFVTACRIYRGTGNGGWRRVRPRDVDDVVADPDMYWTAVIDPLADGRRSAIPKAPQLWPLTLLLDAGDAFFDSADYDGKMPVALIRRAAKVIGG